MLAFMAEKIYRKPVQAGQPEAPSPRDEQLAIGRLATLLANGVDIAVGQNFPAGWEDSRNGKTRRYVAAKEEHLTAARKLLGWDRPAEEKPAPAKEPVHADSKS